MKIMTDRQYELRIREAVEQHMKELDERRWQSQRIEEHEKFMTRTLDRFERDWNNRLSRIEHALGLDRLTCGEEVCEKTDSMSCTPLNVDSLC